jgi:hypothetical protein
MVEMTVHSIAVYYTVQISNRQWENNNWVTMHGRPLKETTYGRLIESYFYSSCKLGIFSWDFSTCIYMAVEWRVTI